MLCAGEEDLSVDDLKECLAQGERLQRPRVCPPVVYNLMTECWSYESTERPTFGEILKKMEKMALQDSQDLPCDGQERGYLVLGSKEGNYTKNQVTESLENVLYITRPTIRQSLTLNMGEGE